MNRTLLNSPLLLGFEHIERLLERNTKAESYPPYNIEHTSDERLKITLAVAGFAAEDLSVTVEDNQLVVRGRLNSNAKTKTFSTVASPRGNSSAASSSRTESRCWEPS